MDDTLEKMRANGLIPKIVIMRADLASSPFGQALQANAETVRQGKLVADVLVPEARQAGRWPSCSWTASSSSRRSAAFERIEKTARLFPRPWWQRGSPPVALGTCSVAAFD